MEHTKMFNQAISLPDGTELGSRNVRDIKEVADGLEGISSYQGKRITVKKGRDDHRWAVIGQVETP
jgi:hypothetical protein|tara:strand:+ start:843 stop:1040 length:198 start_codon:yes stop_codon:yes gene_type:complete